MIQKMIALYVVVISCVTFTDVLALDNGLALTPPLGWMSWERFRCNIDCEHDPKNCIGEKLIMDIADRMAEDGYLEAGYEFVVIDDCWLAKDRTVDRKLQPDPNRFPSGLKALADYIHSKGLKFGLYENFGTMTCKKYPGSEYYLQSDMQQFADWGVDYLKLDGCYSDPHGYDSDYPPVQFFLNITGRPIVYSSAFALHQRVLGIKPNYNKLQKACNLVRNGPDIYDSWQSVMEILTFNGKNEGHFAELAKPGYFNDPDELIVGGFALSWEQQKAHFAMWCLLAGPLMMSVDLRTINPQSKALLQNKYALAIDQDALGIQGQRIKSFPIELDYGSDSVQLWTKPILPKGSYAFALLSPGGGGMPRMVTVPLSDIVKDTDAVYNLTEVFENKPIGHYKGTASFEMAVVPTGIFFGKLHLL